MHDSTWDTRLYYASSYASTVTFVLAQPRPLIFYRQLRLVCLNVSYMYPLLVNTFIVKLASSHSHSLLAVLSAVSWLWADIWNRLTMLCRLTTAKQLCFWSFYKIYKYCNYNQDQFISTFCSCYFTFSYWYMYQETIHANLSMCNALSYTLGIR